MIRSKGVDKESGFTYYNLEKRDQLNDLFKLIPTQITKSFSIIRSEFDLVRRKGFYSLPEVYRIDMPDQQLAPSLEVPSLQVKLKRGGLC
ncbi:MAG TPA: hypothetical protein VMO00_19630 [Methylomirabilota bacterium]|nr:hypothetical protein [Methylomirabilota bacterium]